ncbi:SpoU rRNA Methylase family protein [Algoriphagus alkaliphilus]|uniref:SpoU rRNA Methylase family protein n=1 Tax=Algoriphagus alkaliphilus TaxID=279824 RepID=A0A1G5XVG9_9BACT|nr:SpoU rRNA Methylase family protein [Algoriphagus alkaliphilus]
MSKTTEEITFDQGLLDYLGRFITEHKKGAIEQVLSKRTKYLTVVLEDIFKPHNASAVIRTCDCFGL